MNRYEQMLKSLIQWSESFKCKHDWKDDKYALVEFGHTMFYCKKCGKVSKIKNKKGNKNGFLGKF